MKQLRLFPPCILFTFLFFLNIFTVKAEKPSVIFSQLFYDPPYEERMWFEYADSVHHNGEFIELYNLSAKTIDLSGWKIRSVYPREFVFPAGSSIAGYSSLIVAYRNKKTPDFKLSSVFRQIFEYNIIYQNTLFFNNKSDNLTLLDNKFQTMDQLSYGGTRKAVNGQKLELPQCVSLKRNFTDLSFYPKVSRWITDKVAPNKLNTTNSNNNFPAIQEVIPYEQPKVRDKSASVGFIDVKTTVSPSGAAVVEIPLTFPSGIRGMEPQLKVTYNSQGGLGTMGYGAEISGLSSITRTAPNIYFEGAYGPLTFDSPLSWDGTRLIPDSTDNNRFHTEAFSQNIIEKTGQGFRITSPDGKTIEYGITDDSRIKGNNPGEILAWKINKITDVYGNYITYTYTEFEGKGSYIHKIAYTGTKTNAPATILSFSYIENLYSPQKKWVDGTMFYAGMLLSDIQVECGNRSFRKYEFAYFDARLFSVIEFTPDGKDRKELELEWGTEKTYDGMEQIANYGKRDFGYFNAGSIYGDGRQDLLRFYIDGENKYLDVISQDTSGRYSSINTTKLKKDTEIRPWFKTKRYCRSQLDRAVDIDNDGQDEIAILTRQKINGLMSYGIEIYNYPIRDINNPTKSIYISSNLPENEKQYLLFYNGDNDNKPEFAFLRDDGRMWLYNSEYELARQPFWFTDNLKSGPDRNITSVLQSDFNGDGITDLLVRYNDRWYISNIGPKAESPFNFDNMNLQLIKYDDYDYASLVDYNNDGLPDILFVSRYMSTKLLINDSNGFHEEEKYVFTHLPNIMQRTLEDAYRQQMDYYEDDSPLPSNLYYYCNDMHLISGDFNNDGLIDYGITTLGRIEPRYQDHNLLRIDFHILLLQRRDHTFEYQLGGNWFNHAKDDSDRIQMIPGDFDLDGNTDIGIAIGNNGEISRYKFKNEGKNKNTLYSVSCNGVKIGSFEYEISAKKNIYSNSQVDATSLNTPLLLVKSQEQPDGIGDVTHIDYSYSGGVRSLTGKGFLGFSKITETTRTDAGIAEKITKSVFDSRNDLPPVITSVTTTSRLNNIDLNTETVLSERFMHDNTKKIYSVRRKKTFSEDHLSNTMVMTQYTYDNLERITLEEQTHGKYLESSSSKTVHLTRTTRYTDYNSRNLPGRKEVVQKHIDDPNSFTLANTYAYNEQGDLTECRENVSTPAEVSTAYTYTPAGLPASKTTSAENVETIRETYKYSDDCRFLTEKISKETREAFTYDPVMGNKTLSQVFLPGLPAQTTRYEYDSWGRLVKTTDPEGLTWEKQARWCDTSSPFLYETTEKKSGAPDVVTGYDILGRDIYKRTRKEGVTVEAYTQYDAMGRVIKEISGHSQKMDVTENKYNSRGQLSSVKSSDGKEMVYVYDGTTTNAILNGRHYKTVTTDLCGKTRTLEEAGGGPIRYYYHSCGEYIAIRHDDRHIYFTYDEAGRQTGVEDEDTGKKTYGYDAYGRLTSYKDNTSHYTQQYDSLGRLSFKSYMMSSYRYFYTYVASGPGYGLLQKERCNNGTFTYEYDQMGRILKKTINNDNQVYRYSYDSFGRLAAEISPSGLETTYTYDNEGNQISISTNRHGKVWERKEVIPGLKKRALWGNGFTRQTETSKNGGSYTIRWISPKIKSPWNFTYEIDPIRKNIISRITTERTKKQTESFQYDNMDRLTKINNPYGATSMKYHMNGNIEKKSDVGEYKYDGNRPHAVTDIVNPDSALINSTDYTLNYDENIHRPINIKRTGANMMIIYGPDDQRIESYVYTQPRKVGRRTYHGDNYEKYIINDTIVRQISYLSGPDGPFAVSIYDPVNETDSIFYLHTDIQGSVIALSDNGGKVVERHSYDAWGRERNPDKWDEYVHSTSRILRGYTMHETIPEFGLINMNSRVYDPQLGVFLSPDPLMQDMENSQNFNRYAYCFNNPLKYTDPSGEIAWFIPVIVGAVVGAFSGASIQSGTAAFWSWKSNAWQGAIAGALIGGASGGAAFGVSALGGGAMLAGTTAGTIGGAGFNGIATNWDGIAILKGGTIGAIAGFLGGGVAAATGGPMGAFLGGITSDVTKQISENGDINLGKSLLAGAMSFGMYHGMQYMQYKAMQGKLGELYVTYKQFSKINTAYQRSRFWRKEYGVILNRDGSAKFAPKADRYKLRVDMRLNIKNGDYATAHTHWEKEGVEWVDVGGNNTEFQKYHPGTNYPNKSPRLITVGGYHSPDDLKIPGPSLVVGRTTSTYSLGGGEYNFITPDPFIRFFLFQ